MEKKTGVRYGVRNVYLAWFDEAEDKFETPVALPGCLCLVDDVEGQAGAEDQPGRRHEEMVRR